jgi:hypothetical protein
VPDKTNRSVRDPSAIEIPAVLIRDGADRGAAMRAGIVDPVVIPVTIVRKSGRPRRVSEKNPTEY